MITEEHQKSIREAVSTNDKVIINAAFEKVLHEEIYGIGKINGMMQDYFAKIASLQLIPYKPVIQKKNNESVEKPSKIGLKWTIIYLLLMVCATFVSAQWGLILGICLSVVCSGGVYFYLRQESNRYKANASEVEYTLVETVAEDTLIDLANKFISSIKNLIEEIPQEDDSRQDPPSQVPLHVCYPNILKWLQTIYSDAMFFDDEKSKEYLLKRIVNIADSCYYDFILFDEKDIKKFEVNRKKDLEKSEMVSPAIVYSKTGKVILPGIVFMPQD